eukprot:scaffold9921_cov79-Skeletonema_dohrnii-CCMP3373.AAC.1
MIRNSVLSVLFDINCYSHFSAALLTITHPIDVWMRAVPAEIGVPDASSGHLRRCSDAHTSNQCLSREKDASILSWPTIMGH